MSLGMSGQAVLRIFVYAWLIHASSTGSVFADWTRFRGPNGSGVSTDKDPLPVNWTATKNLQWKLKLPGPGSSSPIVVGDRVFITYWSGYGIDRSNPGDLKQLRRHLICINRDTGKIRWSKAIEAVLPETEYSGMITEHGYASHTPVSDGQHVYAYFGKSGALSFDMNGKQLWQRRIGTEQIHLAADLPQVLSSTRI